MLLLDGEASLTWVDGLDGLGCHAPMLKLGGAVSSALKHKGPHNRTESAEVLLAR